MNFIDLTTETDGAGVSRSVTAQEFLEAEEGTLHINGGDSYVVLASKAILVPNGPGRWYDCDNKQEYSEILITDVTLYPSMDGMGLSPDYEETEWRGTGRYVKL